MAMKLVRKTADYKIFLRGDNRYAVQNAAGKPVNGEEKVNILIAEELVTVAAPPAPEPEVVETEEEAVAEGRLKRQKKRQPKKLPKRCACRRACCGRGRTCCGETPAEEPAAEEEAPAEEPACRRACC